MIVITDKIKRCAACVGACLALLCGCAGHVDTAAWEKTFENSGAVVSLSDCNASETQSTFWPNTAGEPVEILTLEADHIPVMSVQGIKPEQLELYFAVPHETGTALYTLVKPVFNVDYREKQPEDGIVEYRLETVYTYFVVIKTEQGTDEFLLKCTRTV